MIPRFAVRIPRFEMIMCFAVRIPRFAAGSGIDGVVPSPDVLPTRQMSFLTFHTCQDMDDEPTSWSKKIGHDGNKTVMIIPLRLRVARPHCQVRDYQVHNHHAHSIPSRQCLQGRAAAHRGADAGARLCAGYVADEAVALVRRMSSDGFARGRPRQVLCAGTVLAACRVHGRTVRREEEAEITCTDCKAVSRVARMIMERYGLEPASVEERTRGILSRMCSDIDEPGLVRRVLRTYDSVLSAGRASGRSPYVTAACIMRIHTRRFMPEARLAVAVGVPMASMRRYVAEMAPHALSGASGFDAK